MYDGNIDVSQAFRWTESGGMVGLGDLPGGDSYSDASDVSADGSVIVGRSNSVNGGEAFRWTESGGMVGLGDLPGGDSYSDASGVSADGSVIVGRSNSVNGYEAFRWTQETGMVSLKETLIGFRCKWLDAQFSYYFSRWFYNCWEWSKSFGTI